MTAANERAEAGAESSRPTPLAAVESLAERRLLVAFATGDHAAFAELLRRHQAAVYSYLTRCGIRGAPRDDLFQEIFLKVHRAAQSYDPSRPFRAWLFAVTVNTVRSHYRSRRVFEVDAESAEPADPRPNGEQIASARETARWLDAAIARLPFAQREVVGLVCGEHMDQAEVSAVLGIPLGTVKTHLRRARLALAQQLARRDARVDREGGPRTDREGGAQELA